MSSTYTFSCDCPVRILHQLLIIDAGLRGTYSVVEFSHHYSQNHWHWWFWCLGSRECLIHPSPLLLNTVKGKRAVARKKSKLQPSFSFPQRFLLFADVSGSSWLIYTVPYSLHYFVNCWWQHWDWQVLSLTPGLLGVHMDVILLNTWTGCTNMISATN